MFIARQPIFNRAMKVYGYELLYRDSETATRFNNMPSGRSTATVLSGLFELGIETISSNKKSFINFDHEFLFSDSIELIEPENLIIEVLEDTKIDERLINRLVILKGKGYKIALDDFIEDYESFSLTSIADIIKYDLMETPLNSIEREVRKALSHRKILIAEKIETKAQYDVAKKMGFHLFQGFFFEKPNIVAGTSNKKSPKLSYLELLNELKSEDPSFDQLTNIITNDVNLSHRLLMSTQKSKSNSDDFMNQIKQALVYMGLKQIKRWVDILMLRDLATNKPDELTRLSLIRAHFGELLAEQSTFRSRSNEIYGMFLFSSLDALLDQSMTDALEDLDLSDAVKEALISGEGELVPLLQLVLSYEKGEWEKVEKLSAQINISEKKIRESYLESIRYSKEIMDDTYTF